MFGVHRFFRGSMRIKEAEKYIKDVLVSCNCVTFPERSGSCGRPEKACQCVPFEAATDRRSVAAMEAAWILQEVLAVSVSDYAAMGRHEISTEDFSKACSMADRRVAGEPLQYILGNSEFYGRRFYVAPGVLIPRPETETLVELALSLPRPSNDVCDLCSGSGVIALTVACELGEESHIVAADISPEAIKLGEKNRQALGCTNVSFYQGDLFEPLPPAMKFGLIISNPPYVSPAEYAHLPGEVRDYEPDLALVAGKDGLELLERLAHEARNWLLPGGWLICEMGENQGHRMESLLTRLGYDHVAIGGDLTGRDRYALGSLRSW